METYKCPSCGYELDDTGQDERLEEFIIWGTCGECNEEYKIVFKATRPDPWHCPECGGDCTWDIDEEGDLSEDEKEYVVYGACDECGRSMQERYIFDRIEL